VKAQESVDKAIALDPKDPESYILKGDILFDVDPSRASEPLALYKKAIELAPKAARPVTKKAFILPSRRELQARSGGILQGHFP
jgi:tetratricopeptide (TPR) repeat protein